MANNRKIFVARVIVLGRKYFSCGKGIVFVRSRSADAAERTAARFLRSDAGMDALRFDGVEETSPDQVLSHCRGSRERLAAKEFLETEQEFNCHIKMM
jgi:hypothetical protein